MFRFFTRERFWDFVFGAALGSLFKYVFKIPSKVAENAMISGIGDWIADTLGLSWAYFFSFVGEWGLSLGLAVAILFAWHFEVQRRAEQRIRANSFSMQGTLVHGEPNSATPKKMNWIIPWLFIVGGPLIGLSLLYGPDIIRAVTTAKNVKPSVSTLSPAIAENRDPDTIYQHGESVGSVEAVVEELSRGQITFGLVRGAMNLDTNGDFEYRKHTLHVVSFNAEAGNREGRNGRWIERRLFQVICRIIDKKSEAQPAQKAKLPDEDKLIGHIRVLYDRRSNQVEMVSKTDRIKIATVERDQNSFLDVSFSPLTAKIVFYADDGPYLVNARNMNANQFNQWTPTMRVVENESRFVSLRIETLSVLAPVANSIELKISFYRA